MDELEALKRTVVSSHSLVIPTESVKTVDSSTVRQSTQSIATELAINPGDLIVPSYLRVLEAEQTLVNNFVYEEEN